MVKFNSMSLPLFPDIVNKTMNNNNNDDDDGIIY